MSPYFRSKPLVIATANLEDEVKDAWGIYRSVIEWTPETMYKIRRKKDSSTSFCKV